MKKCPYCAEEIQDEAVKCRFCMEFLGEARESHAAPPRMPAVVEPPNPVEPWYYKRSFLILMFLTFPPFVLPFVWIHPRMHWAWKIGVTLAVVAFCWLAWWAIAAFLGHFFELAEMIQQMNL